MGRMMQAEMAMNKEEEKCKEKNMLENGENEKKMNDNGSRYYYDEEEANYNDSYNDSYSGMSKVKVKVNKSYSAMSKVKVNKSYSGMCKVKVNNSYYGMSKVKVNSYMYMMMSLATLTLAAEATLARRLLLNNLSPPPPPSASSAWSSAPLYTSASLEYYVHALSNSTAYTSRAPSSPNWSSSYGLSAAFDYNVTAASAADSAALGFIRGFEIVDSLSTDPMTILVLNSVNYDDGYYVGAVSLHGAANVNDTDYDIAIAGGTGSFRGAAGVASITNLHTPGADHVFRHILHFTHLH